MMAFSRIKVLDDTPDTAINQLLELVTRCWGGWAISGDIEVEADDISPATTLWTATCQVEREVPR